jgi:hypothetical protein
MPELPEVQAMLGDKRTRARHDRASHATSPDAMARAARRVADTLVAEQGAEAAGAPKKRVESSTED